MKLVSSQKDPRQKRFIQIRFTENIEIPLEDFLGWIEDLNKADEKNPDITISTWPADEDVLSSMEALAAYELGKEDSDLKDFLYAYELINTGKTWYAEVGTNARIVEE